MLPRAFRNEGTIRLANVHAVGAALASMTTACVSTMFGHGDGLLSAIVAVPTLLIGWLWALSLRSRTRVTRRQIQLGWLLSLPLAMLNAASVGALIFAADRGHDLLPAIAGGAFLGVTFGAIVWVPALVATLLAFGVPIARAQRLAAQGLAGEERGERFVGVTSAVIAALGLAVCASQWQYAARAMMLPALLGSSGLAAGVLAAVLSQARGQRRARFVADVEAGRVDGYRVDVVPAGKVLVRVEGAANAYRDAERFAAVFELAPDGEAKRAIGVDGSSLRAG